MATSMNSAGTCTGLTDISTFNGADFASWRSNLTTVFAFMDWDLPFREDRPTVNEQSTSNEKRLIEKWDRSNHLCLMIMKRFIPESLWATNQNETVTAKEFLDNIEKRLIRNVRSEKSEISTLLANLVSMKYRIKGDIREHITEMCNIVSKLGALEIEISEEVLVHLVLISLPSYFEQFKMNYNSRQGTWSLDELISHCVQEDERLKRNLSCNKKAKRAEKRKREEAEKDCGKELAAERSAEGKPEEGKKLMTEGISCFFCGAAGHMKKQCHNYYAWLAKKGIGCELQCNKPSKPSEPKLLTPSKKSKPDNIPHQDPCDTQTDTNHFPPNNFSSIEIGHSRVFVPRDDDRPNKPSDGSNLYISSLPQSIHNGRLADLFKPFGRISHSFVAMDANTGRSKGYGFVKYTDYKSAVNAIAAMNGTVVEGKRIAVRVAGVPPGNAPVHKTSKSDGSCQIAANCVVNAPNNQPRFPVSMANSSIRPWYNSPSESTAPNRPNYPMLPKNPTEFCPARRSVEMPVVNIKSEIFPTAEDFATFPGYLRSFDDPKTAVGLSFDVKQER